jgi:hypothetical protein
MVAASYTHSERSSDSLSLDYTVRCFRFQRSLVCKNQRFTYFLCRLH